MLPDVGQDYVLRQVFEPALRRLKTGGSLKKLPHLAN